MNGNHIDVLIVGAGISGIGAAYHLQKNCPSKEYLVLEGRDDLGGTWDLFKYPGIRSDSDMHTLGYSFKPWTHPQAIAEGPAILDYLREAAEENGIVKNIRFGHQVDAASWCSESSRWTVTAQMQKTGQVVGFTCNFLFMCSGYYDYAQGYSPEFAGSSDFRGQIVHPQNWPENLDYSGKQVVVIGSGATAVTLIPEMAKTTEHITMLQRSPTYVVAQPDEDKFANLLRRYLPNKWAYSVTRWKNILWGLVIFQLVKLYPEKTKISLIDMVRKELPDFDVDKHFTPSYMPWDQRVCVVPNSDLFAAIRNKRASVVTDQIDRFVTNGIKLKSGETLSAEIIITATGLNLQFLSDVAIRVDGKLMEPTETVTYKGMMYTGIPNMALSSGYFSASWTLKCDLTCEYVCRLLNFMDENGYRECQPQLNDPAFCENEAMSFTSSYVQRSIHKFPKQGVKPPWCLSENYVKDRLALKYGAIADDVMLFR
ncbi:MAG: NAD(P)/FAD-dependent oxidoreductase [Gammaproteobacteria bacterium]|nr:NAD(P)/FAD-dependent oxidoreductase [Gammaproteobacteria bacterium]